MDLAGIIVWAVSGSFFILWGSYYFYFYPKLANKFEYDGLARFKEYLTELRSPYSDYTYFTDGHITWSETSISEIIEQIRRSCRPFAPEIGFAAASAKFLLHSDEDRKRVYIVFTSAKTFDWASIPHFEEYLGGPNR